MTIMVILFLGSWQYFRSSSTAIDHLPSRKTSPTATRLQTNTLSPFPNSTTSPPSTTDSSCWEKIGPVLEKLCDQTCFHRYLDEKSKESIALVELGWFDHKKRPISNTEFTIAMYLEGLAYAGAIEDRLPLDYDKAHDILKSVHARDPSGHVALWLAYVEYRRDNFQNAQHWLRRASEAESFTNPIVAWNYRLSWETFSDARYYVHAISLTSAIPFPNLGHVRDMLLEFPEEGKAVSLKLTSNAIKLDGYGENFHWSTLDYAIGHDLLQKLSPPDAATIPHWRDLRKLEFDPTDIWMNPNCSVTDVTRDGKKLLKELSKQAESLRNH